MDKTDLTNVSPNAQGRTRVTILLLIVMLLILACLSTPPTISQRTQNPESLVTQKPIIPSFPEEFSSKIGDFRFYTLDARRIAFLQIGDQTYNANEGFEFLVVNLIIENLSDQPLQMYYFTYTAKGDTPTGEYTYPEYRINSTSYFGMLPPHFRVHHTVIFEIAKNISELKLAIEARSQRDNFTGEITLPETGIKNAIELPYGTDDVSSIMRVGEDFAWIQGITCKIIDVVRVGSGLQIVVEINNPTGYAIKPFELFSGAVVFDMSGSAYPLVSTEVDLLSIPPALTKTVRFYMDFSFPENMSGSVLFLQGDPSNENKWVNLDILNAEYIWRLLHGINTGEREQVSISWSPDSHAIASAQSDGYGVGHVQIWDATSGALLHTLSDTEVGWSIAWSPDGSTIATGTQGQIKLYNVNDYSLRTQIFSDIELRNENMSILSWSPDNTKIVSLMPDPALVQVWDTASGLLIKSHRISNYKVYDNVIYTNGAWSIDGKFLAIGSSVVSGPVRIYDASNWENVKEITVFYHNDWKNTDSEINQSVSWSPDGKFLAMGGCSYNSDCPSFAIVNFETGENYLVDIPKPILNVTWIQNGKRLAIVSKDYDICRVYIWDVTNKQFTYVLPCNQTWNRFTSTIWSRDGSKLAIGDDDGNIYIWGFSPLASP